MPDEILKKTITISGVEDTGTQVKIKDENGKRYSFFKLKKDGSHTKAFEQFEHYKVGDSTGINYKEIPYKDGFIKNLLGFAPAGIENTRQAKPMQAKMERPGGNDWIQNQINPPTEKDEKFWDKKAYKQCLWNYWLEKLAPIYQKDGKDLTEQSMDLVWNVFNQIEQDANKRFATGWAKAQATFEKPFIEEPLPQNEEPLPEYTGQDIPF